MSMLAVIIDTLQMLHRKDGTFDIESALNEIIEKYGQDLPKDSDQKEKKRKLIDSEDTAEKEPAAKKTSKLDTVVEERNRALADAIKEMAGIYFKNKDARKGGIMYSSVM